MVFAQVYTRALLALAVRLVFQLLKP